jgi:ABC-type branched-subunit amino acid transport system permease subunit
MRENERSAQSVSITPVRTKLTAFVISGTVAGVGGALYTYLNQSFVVTSYGTAESFAVFTSAVIGGLGSLGGWDQGSSVVDGPLLHEADKWF